MTLVFTIDDVKNDVSLCKLDVNVKNRTAVLNFSSEKFYFIASTTSKIKCGRKSNVVNQKVCKIKYLSWVYGVDRKKPSLEITVRHHSTSLVMPVSDPRDGFVYPHHTPIKYTYSLAHGLTQHTRDVKTDF